jgi:hypothetical protein
MKRKWTEQKEQQVLKRVKELLPKHWNITLAFNDVLQQYVVDMGWQFEGEQFGASIEFEGGFKGMFEAEPNEYAKGIMALAKALDPEPVMTDEGRDLIEKLCAETARQAKDFEQLKTLENKIFAARGKLRQALASQTRNPKLYVLVHVDLEYLLMKSKYWTPALVTDQDNVPHKLFNMPVRVTISPDAKDEVQVLVDLLGSMR